LISVGFEANPNASSGRKVSIANGSEGGRLRRRSGTTGEKESLPLRQLLISVGFEVDPHEFDFHQ